LGEPGPGASWELKLAPDEWERELRIWDREICLLAESKNVLVESMEDLGSGNFTYTNITQTLHRAQVNIYRD